MVAFVQPKEPHDPYWAQPTHHNQERFRYPVSSNIQPPNHAMLPHSAPLNGRALFGAVPDGKILASTTQPDSWRAVSVQ